MRRLSWLCAATLAALAAPAQSEGPEELEQLEPDGGDWQVEYYGILGRHEGDSHAFQLLYGINDAVALGVEIEAEKEAGSLLLEEIAPTLLLRFSDPERHPVGAGLALQAGFDRGGGLAELEARLIVERRRPLWWLQGNAVLRHVREDGASASLLAYSGSVSRAVGEDVWLGLEAGGQVGRLDGAAAVIEDGGHFLGPALTVERELGGAEIELGVAWLRRIAGGGASDSARLFVQFTF